jgi:hypothetical protein
MVVVRPRERIVRIEGANVWPTDPGASAPNKRLGSMDRRKTHA